MSQERKRDVVGLAQALRAAWIWHERGLAPASLGYVLLHHVPREPGAYWRALAERVLADRTAAAQDAEARASERLRPGEGREGRE